MNETNNLKSIFTNIVSTLLLIAIISSQIFSQKSETITIEVSYSIDKFDYLGQQVNLAMKPSKGYWDYNLQAPVILYTKKIQATEGSFIINNYQTQPLTTAELNLIDKANVSNDFKVNVSVKEQRFEKYVSVEIIGIRKTTNGSFEKLITVEGNLTVRNIPKLTQKSFAANSVLEQGNGKWYKIGIPQDGMYKIDRDYLQNLGVNISNLNPNIINIYGNAQGMLSEFNGAPRIDDLIANSIFIKGDQDGVFDANDYIVFYAKGPHSFSFDGIRFSHQQNKFTDTAYYFININPSGVPIRIQNTPLSSDAPTHVVSTFQDYGFYEDDIYNLNKSGKEWMGDPFDTQLSKNYSFTFSNVTNIDSVELRARVVIQSTSIAPFFSLSSNNVSKTIKASGASGQGYTNAKGRFATESLRFKTTNSTINYSFSFDKSGFISSLAWLDWVEINLTRNLIMNGNQMEFRNIKSIGNGNVTQYNLSNANSVAYIWETTNPRNPKLVAFNKNGSLIDFTVTTDSLRTFVAFTDDLYYIPVSFGAVAPQNLHGLNYADIIIITDPNFKLASEKLALHHYQKRGFTTHIVTQQEIFNEYSSGMRDPVAIRHFLKMFYDRANGDEAQLPKYVILMGDATYDFRNKFNTNANHVISYQTNESLNPITSFASDDFYVILNDNATMANNELMDMAIGRFPVKNQEEAMATVNKVIRYETNNSATNSACYNCNSADNNSIYGDWRNRIVLISDDADNNHYFNDIEEMSNKVKVQHDEINVIKIHSDATVETITPGGERNFGAEQGIKDNVQNGALMVNYIGHGGETGWAHESILTVPTIQNWTNSVKMPIFMTATCEFSRYDDHDRTSAGEFVVLNENGGGIALFTTTRLVFSSSNSALTRIFYDTIFDKLNGVPKTLGQIYNQTKNKYALTNGDVEFRKFTLLGDPVIQLAQPHNEIRTDSVNGISISIFNDTLKALSKVRISGQLVDFMGNELNNFNGVVYPTIYDKESQLTTLANSPGSFVANFNMWKNIVYKGKATVTNGKFSLEFIVPQDISYTVGASRFSFYAENQQTDAHGYSHEAKMGGINLNASVDDQGPTVQLFLNNFSFVNGGMTNESPMLLSKIFDENGINTVGNGIGHNLEVRIDNNSEPINLNEYYEADLDTYKSGKISFPLSDLSPGNHVLHLKVWDVYNNSTDTELEFTVVAEEDIAINNLLNYPNPFTTNTEFSFETNQICDYLDIQIQVFSITGKLIKTIQQRNNNNGFRINGIFWDGRDDYGDKIAIGTYIYKITIHNEKGEKVSKYEKLVILG
jgi:hypothetical protein